MSQEMDLFMGTVIGLVMLLLVIGLLLAAAYKESSSYKFDKRYLSQDVSLFIDALYTSPNEVVVRYPQRTYGYGIQFQPGRTKVYEPNEGVILAEEYPFTESAQLEFIYSHFEPNIGLFDDEIIIGDIPEQTVPLVFFRTSKQIVPSTAILREEFLDS